jgi:hypothetical protein
MIRWREKAKVESEKASMADKVLLRVHRFVLKVAKHLQMHSNVLSKRTKMMLLALFVFLFCTASALVLYQGIVTPSAQYIAPAKMKVVPLQQDNQTTRIARSEYLRVQRFKNYMDSLGQNIQGRRLRDSLLRRRPQLMDSVNVVLQLYSEQNKNNDDGKTKNSY